MRTPKLTRRTFLKATAAASALTSLPTLAQPPATPEWPENGNLIPDTGWHLQLDPQAKWQQDAIHLPGEFKLEDLPTNPPTGGWQTLTPASSKEITLPTTVEQHFWGAPIPGVQNRPYTPEEYRYAADDPIPQNGAYYGVSWFFRPIDIPAEHEGKRLFLHLRGARLRAEVYLNQKLVGYSIMEELPFECDITAAATPGGENQLAIRITNPFGRFDWVDGTNAQWGAVSLYRSHGFAGIDRGITLSAHEGTVRIADLWVLNKPDPKAITINYTLKGFRGISGGSASPKFEVVDPRTEVVIATTPSRGQGSVALFADTDEGMFTEELRCDKAQPWSLDNPVLYHLRASLTGIPGSTRTIPFGFRTFAPANIGSKTLPATFRLNGKRIRLYSSISWGFWGYNGLFPTPELAEKEVTQAKKLNLNTLNFHRNLAKEDVLRAGDRLGLLRYLEPGGGKLAVGKLPSNTAANAAGIVMQKPTSEADKFAQRFMIAKCVSMVRAFRGHTSVIQYTLQNEIGADLNNPDTLSILSAMRQEDPSRSIVLNDGFVAPPRKAAQAWYEPWNETLHRSDKEEWGLWWNQHQGAGDQWYDEFYKSPRDFTYAAPNYPGVLTEFGEMEGCATPDNHALMLHQQAATPSYDKKDHAEIDAAYNTFLDRWNFRAAFPTTEHLYNSLGKKCYDTWQNYLENARISDDLDFAVISGWESTSIENHSGILDNQRNFKSDPTPIAATLQPIRPIAKQRTTVIAQGQTATFDLFLCNDTGNPATGTLTFTALTPSNKLLTLATIPAPTQSPDTFSYLLKESFQTPPLTEEGLYRFKFAISSAPTATQTKEIWVQNFTRMACNENRKVAVSGIPPALKKQLTQMGRDDCFDMVDFAPGQKYAAIITAGLTATTKTTQDSGDTTGLEAQPGTKPVPGRKPEPGEAPTSTQQGHIDPAVLEAVKQGTPLLVIPQTDALSEGCAQQLAAAGAFQYKGTVGDFRAPWMGNWYFVRQHPTYAGLPVDQAMGIHYQAKGRQSNGLIVDGPNVEIIAAYSRDHDRNLGAGTFTTKLGSTKILYHRIPDFHPVLQQRFLANALQWLTT